MAGSKAKNSSTKPEDEEVLKSEVASFASSLGLSSTLPSSGFNDSDFRKTGRLKANTPAKKQKQSPGKKPSGSENLKGRNSNPNEKSKPKPPVLAIDDNDSNPKVFEKYKNLPKLPLVKASAVGSWYVDAEELEAKLVGDKQLGVKNVEEWRSVVEKKRELGKRLMAQFSQDYVSSRGQSGDIKMLITTQRSGTAADKVSAFSVMVGDNPIANLRSLDALIGMVTSKVGKRHALTGFEALRELFVSSLLPDRKLKTLLQRPLNHLPDNKDGYSLLLFWYWEECLKQRYERFIFALEEASRDMLPVLKQKALKNIYALLKSKSEQERRLLSALVNKLGDPESKGASNADYHLSNLLSDHPNMKAVVIDEVDSFLFRPRLGLRAKYHAVNFLSQIRLSNKEDGPKVAKRLVDVYFALFKVLITEGSSGQKIDKSLREDNRKSFTSSKNKKEDLSESHIEMDSRLLSTLLTGINRAFPFVLSDGADDVIEVQTPMLFQLVHSKNFNVGVQALLLLDKISSKNQVVSDRFYRALYSKLLLPAALSSSKAEMFIGLLLRAMKNDVNLKRVAAFAKRILQVALQQQPQYACGYLFLISEVLKARPPLWNLVLQNESIDEELEHFEDIEEETNNEPSTAPEELESDVKLLQNNNAVLSDRDSSEDENDSTASSSEEDDEDEAEEFQINNDDNEMEVSKITPVNNGQKAQVPSNNFLLPGGYEPRHREPSYCNADCVSWWELSVLASHTHPSVSTMARTILSGTNIVYNGNPLHDLSLTAFLDKFMEKKPKQTTWHGGSQIEPAKKLDMNNHLIGPEILSLAEDDVPPEDLVFHKFYTFKMNTSNKTKKKKKKKGSEEEAAEELFDVDGDGGDGDDGDDESDNEEIDNLLESNLSVEAADGDYDYDDLDRVANEDDENLTGNVSDEDIDVPSDLIDGEELDACFDDADEDMVEIGDEAEERSDVEEDERLVERKKRKRKNGKSGVSPFASLEDYEHLLEDGGAVRKEDSTQKKKSTRKKRS